MSKFTPVSKAHPCAVCGGDHKCSVAADGLILCGRESGGVSGFRCLGTCKDPQWTKYRPLNSAVLKAHGQPSVGVTAPSMSLLCDKFAANLHPLQEAELANRLNLPASVFARMTGLGFDPESNAFLFPEHDATGHVIGLLRRFPDGSKKTLEGSHRGISMVGGWADAAGPVFLVEGPSDTLALAACDLAVLGRPSNTGGKDILANLLRSLDEKRPIVVVGENDAKQDGSWPGKEGAKRLAEDLAVELQRTIQCTLPPPQYKDVRDWVSDRWQGAAENFDWKLLGLDVCRDLVQHAIDFTPQSKKDAAATLNGMTMASRKFPLPVLIEDLELPAPGGVKWLWEGFLPRDSVVLLSALPKCGKTTLLSHLLAVLPSGGSFCDRAIAPGRAVIISEEPAGVWAARRTDVHMPEGAIRVIARGKMKLCSTLDEWLEFIAFLKDQLDGDPADLIVFDTIANLWPVRDENSAADVGLALKPLHQLTENRCVLLVHHLRKSDGAEGTGSRGSGALAGFVDVILELRRAKTTSDPGQRKRVLSGFGRYDAIPTEWVIELVDPASGGHHPPVGSANPADLENQQGADAPRSPCFIHVDPTTHRKQSTTAKVEHREEAEEQRLCKLRECLLLLIPFAAPGQGWTRQQLWDSLPPELQVNQVRFKSVLEAECGKLWTKDVSPGKSHAFTYRRDSNVTAKEELFPNEKGLPD